MSASIAQFLSLIVVRSDFKQPGIVNLYHLSHELFGGKHKFMVDDPPRSVVS